MACNTIGGIKDYGTSKAQMVTDYGTSKAQQVLELPYSKALLGQVDGLLDLTDKYIDVYLPTEEKEGKSEKYSLLIINIIQNTAILN